MKKRIQFTEKDIPKYVAEVLGTESKELYQETFAKIKENFGEDSLAYKKITNNIDSKNITGSNFFFVNQLNKQLGIGQKVITLKDIDNIFSTNDDFFNDLYTDTNQLVLRSFKATWEQNQPVLNYLKRQLEGCEISPENPLIITNPELVKADNEYGLKVKIGKDTIIENDKRFSNKNNKIHLGNLEKTLWTKNNGLSGLYLGGGSFLVSSDDILANSGSRGRVVIVSTEGDAKIFEDYRTRLELEKQNKIDEIEFKYKKAADILNK